MSISTLPKVAAELDLCAGTWYAAKYTVPPALTVGDENNVVWRHIPVLPADGSMVWADEPEVTGDHVTLDQETLAAILFCSALNTASDPGEYELLDAIDTTLTAYRCRAERCVNEHLNSVGDYPEDTARRWTWCITCAARLLGTVV